jgi:hypothetical protein
MVFKTGKMKTVTGTGSDGFTNSIQVPETRTIHLCEPNIMWLAHVASGNREEADKLAHDPSECGKPHYRPDRFDNKKLCGACIARIPCRYGSACNFNHPENFPQVVEDASTQGATHGTDSASVTSRSMAPRAPRVSRSDQSFSNKNSLMCKKELAKTMSLKLPEGENACPGGCGFAHSIKDLVCERVLAGELDFQKIADELVAFWLKATEEERSFILKANKVNREPMLSTWCFDQWLDFWITAASTARTNKKILTDALKVETDEEKKKQLSAKISSINVFGLFEGEDSLEENIVWELKRCSHSCSTSYSMQMQAMGGAVGICYSSDEKDESFSPELLAKINAEFEKLTQLRQECISITSNKLCSVSSKEKAMETLRDVNTKLGPLEKRIASLKLRPLCSGGTYCKKGAHFDAVDDNGLLFVFDFDELLGKRKTDGFYRSNIVKLREQCKDAMEALNFERKELVKALASTSQDDKAARKENQSRMQEVNQELEFLRKEFIGLYNKIRFFNKTETLTSMPEESSVQFTVRIPPAFVKVTETGGNIGGDDPDLPEYKGDDESEEAKAEYEWRSKLRAFRQRVMARKEKKANDLLRAAVAAFRSTFEEKVRKIANAANADEARTLYDNLISIRCYVALEKEDRVSLKNRARTADGRLVFYLDITEDGIQVYRSDSYGVLRVCEPGTALTSDTFKQMKERFNHASFKAFYGSGAFRFMSYYEYEAHPIMRQALEVFTCKPRPEGWDIFTQDVKKELHRYNTMDIIETKVMKPGVWDPEDPEPFEIVQTVVSCPEKEQYNDFWSFYLRTPMVTDPKVVGTDSKLAIAEPQLFATFRESGTKQTFTAWLLANADFVPSKEEPTLEAWLNAPRNTSRKYNRATYLAYKSGKYLSVNWRQLKHYINIVVPVCPEMTIQTFVENEYFATIWATSSASRNIGATNGGIPFATFATNPYEYQEFYEHGCNTNGVSFEQFLQDKKDGWIRVVPRNLKKLDVLSLAWLSPELITKDMLANIKMQLWRVNNLSEFNDVPSKTFQIINKTTSMMVPRSICDEQLFELLTLLVKKSTDASAIRNLLEQIPTTAVDANSIRMEMIAHYQKEMTAKINRKRDAFIGIANGQSGFKTVQPFLASLPTEEQVAEIHQFIDSLSKRKREQTNIFFDDFLRTAKINVPDNITAITENIKMDVHSIHKVVQKGDDEEIKVIQPPLLQAAREYLIKLSESKSSTKATSSKTVKTTRKSEPEAKVEKTKTTASSPAKSSSDLDVFEDQFRPDAAFFKKPMTKTQTELQKSGRVQLFGDQKLYINNIRITKEREEVKSFSYWVVGPFETKAEASALKSVVQRILKTSGVQVEKYQDSGLMVFETLIPDATDGVMKQARKWGLEDYTVSAMKNDVLDKMVELIPHITKATNTPVENIVSSLIKKEEKKEVKSKKAEDCGFSFEDEDEEDEDEEEDTNSVESDSSDETSVAGSDDSDSEDEVLIGREVTMKHAPLNQDEESDNLALQAQRSFGASKKSRRYDGPATRDAPARGGKGPKGKDY